MWSSHPTSFRETLSKSQKAEYKRLFKYAEEILSETLDLNEVKSKLKEMIENDSCPYILSRLKRKTSIPKLYSQARRLMGKVPRTLAQKVDDYREGINLSRIYTKQTPETSHPGARRRQSRNNFSWGP